MKQQLSEQERITSEVQAQYKALLDKIKMLQEQNKDLKYQLIGGRPETGEAKSILALIMAGEIKQLNSSVDADEMW